MRTRVALFLLAVAVLVTSVLSMPTLSLSPFSFKFLRSEACQDPIPHPCP